MDTPNVEPFPGAFWLTTAPAVAPREWQFLFRTDDGRISREPETVPAGSVAEFGQGQMPGVFYVILNGTECAGSFHVMTAIETVIEVNVADNGECSVSIVTYRDVFEEDDSP